MNTPSHQIILLCTLLLGILNLQSQTGCKQSQKPVYNGLASTSILQGAIASNSRYLTSNKKSERLIPQPAQTYIVPLKEGLRGPLPHQPGVFGRYSSPQHIHSSLIGDPRYTRAITWRTDSGTKAGQILLRDDQGNEYLLPAHSISFKDKQNKKILRIHEAVIENLTPGTTYQFKVGTKGTFSDLYSFQTAPEDNSTPFSFVVLGDSRRHVDFLAKHFKAINKHKLAFILHTGDLVHEGKNQIQWDEFFDTLHKWIPTTPFMPVPGNHENNGVNYFGQFTLPDSEINYHFIYGNTLVIGLSYLHKQDHKLIDEARDYLIQTLEDHPDITWRFVFHHQPIYSSGKHGSRKDLQKQWAPLYDKYHVDIVFTGHDHIYLRTHPIKEGKRELIDKGVTRGTVYVVTGGGGAGLHKIEKSWFTAVSAKVHHHCLVHINGPELTMSVYKKDGQKLVDQLTLRKYTPEST